MFCRCNHRDQRAAITLQSVTSVTAATTPVIVSHVTSSSKHRRPAVRHQYYPRSSALTGAQYIGRRHRDRIIRALRSHLPINWEFFLNDCLSASLYSQVMAPAVPVTRVRVMAACAVLSGAVLGIGRRPHHRLRRSPFPVLLGVLLPDIIRVTGLWGYYRSGIRPLLL